MSKISRQNQEATREERTLFTKDRKSTRSPLLQKRLRQKKFQHYFSWPILLAVSASVILLSSFWLSGYFTTLEHYFIQKFHAMTGSLGFVVKDVVIEGRNKIPAPILKKAIDVKIGDSLTQHNLTEIKDRLQQIDWVKDCVVYRQLPNQLFIKIIERYPIALWHNQKNVYVIDNSGIAILIHSLKDYSHLPHFTGENAPEKAHEILKVIEDYPIVKENLTSYNRIRKRRWDLVLFKTMIVKLPEESLHKDALDNALKKLYKLLSLKTITAQNTHSVDLRIENKQFIQKK